MISRAAALLGSSLLVVTLNAAASPRLVEGGGVSMGLGDVALVDHRGQKVRVLSDLLQNEGVTVVNFVYYGCDVTCPTSSITLQALDNMAPASVKIASITISPLTDTPAVLARMADKFGASSRWSWITGAPDDVYRLLDRVGFRFGADVKEHELIFLIASKGKVLRFDGLPELDEFLRAIDQVARR